MASNCESSLGSQDDTGNAYLPNFGGNVYVIVDGLLIGICALILSCITDCGTLYTDLRFCYNLTDLSICDGYGQCFGMTCTMYIHLILHCVDTTGLATRMASIL